MFSAQLSELTDPAEMIAFFRKKLNGPLVFSMMCLSEVQRDIVAGRQPLEVWRMLGGGTVNFGQPTFRRECRQLGGFRAFKRFGLSAYLVP